MNINEAKEKYIFYTEIKLEDDDFIKLREPTVKELNNMNRVDEKSIMDELEKLFPACLVDHNFTEEDGTKCPNEKVVKLLKDSGSLFVEVVEYWTKSLPFQSRLEREGT
jgi:hypothetical protein